MIARPDHGQWTLSSFWDEPWQKADIIAAWSDVLGLAAIVVALALALWEQRRARRADERRQTQYVDDVIGIIEPVIESGIAWLALMDGGTDEALRDAAERANAFFVRGRRALDSMQRFGPPDGVLAMTVNDLVATMGPLDWRPDPIARNVMATMLKGKLRVLAEARNTIAGRRTLG